MFSNHISDRGLKSRTYKELWKLSNKKTNNPIWKESAKDLNSFPKEKKNIYIYKWETMVNREIQIKTTMRHYYIPTRIV